MPLSFNVSPLKYNVLTRVFHWLSALSIFGLFGLGWYMVDLTYYDDWYQTAPFYHISIGITLLFITLLRIVWRILSNQHFTSNNKLNDRIARLGHLTLYLLLAGVLFSGYLISSADEASISVFGIIDIPTLQLMDNQEELAGEWHEYSAWGLVIMGILHALAALWHHFIKSDNVLTRML